MATKRGRTQACGAPQARQRLAQARSYLDVAALTADENDPNLEYAGVAASVAILAGIAAADAACCQVLGRRSRSETTTMPRSSSPRSRPEGKKLRGQLRQLIDIKDTAHYGFISVTAAQLKRALRQAQHLIDFAEQSQLRS